MRINYHNILVFASNYAMKRVYSRDHKTMHDIVLQLRLNRSAVFCRMQCSIDLVS